MAASQTACLMRGRGYGPLRCWDGRVKLAIVNAVAIDGAIACSPLGVRISSAIRSRHGGPDIEETRPRERGDGPVADHDDDVPDVLLGARQAVRLVGTLAPHPVGRQRPVFRQRLGNGE